MRKLKYRNGWSVAILVLLLNDSPLVACGDKLLVLSQGTHFKLPKSQFRAGIILYMNPAAPGFDSFKDDQFQKVMQDVGHYWKSVRSKDDLAAELKSKRYDIVIADLADAPGLEELIRSASSQAVILPWVFAEPGANKDTIKKAKAAGKQRYSFILEAPAKVSKVVSLIDMTMENKPKLMARLRAAAVAKPI